jgi:hypothetical protein
MHSERRQTGELTTEFGVWLAEWLNNRPRYRGYYIRYSHGDPESDHNVAHIQGFHGEEPSLAANLAFPDVMVATPDRNIAVLVEREDIGELRPKMVVGSVFTNLMCNGYAVKQGQAHLHFRIVSATQLIIAGIVRAGGYKREQIERTIAPLLRQFVVPRGGIDVGNVTFIFRDDNLAVTGALQARMNELFP